MEYGRGEVAGNVDALLGERVDPRLGIPLAEETIMKTPERVERGRCVDGEDDVAAFQEPVDVYRAPISDSRQEQFFGALSPLSSICEVAEGTSPLPAPTSERSREGLREGSGGGEAGSLRSGAKGGALLEGLGPLASARHQGSQRGWPPNPSYGGQLPIDGGLGGSLEAGFRGGAAAPPVTAKEKYWLLRQKFLSK